MAVLRRALAWAAGLLAAILIYQVATLSPGTRDLWAVMLERAARGWIGVGTPGQNRFDFAAAGLEPGDIVLGHNPGSSWGHWTHAALYVGDGLVVDTLLRHGVYLDRVERFAYAYQASGVLKVQLPPAVKQRAVDEAMAVLGRPFNLLSGRHQDGWFYCTQVVWYAYQRAGVDLDPAGGYWVVPDRFLDSGHVTLVLQP